VNGVDPRIESLALLGAVTLFLMTIRPRRPAAPADDTLEMLSAVELQIEEPSGTRTVRVPVPVTIGRGPPANVVLSDTRVSRLHARIDVAGGELCVRDLESRNGTWLNELPIDDPVPLRRGDQIELGMTRIVYGGVGPLA
jgi:pSer/pThr/pTyr-binding forkhead associated (FHA) protein